MSRMTKLARMGAFAALFTASTMRGVNETLPQNLPSIPIPPAVAQMSKRQRRRLALRAHLKMERWRINDSARRRNRRAARSLRERLLGGRDAEDRRVQDILNRMSNYRRTRWRRDGHASRDLATVQKYDNLNTSKAGRWA